MSNQSANFPESSEPGNAARKSINCRLLSIGATIGLLGGTWMFLAAAFSTIYNFLFTEQPQGSWLFLAALPLWVFGAYCFDQSEDGSANKIKD